MPCSLVAGYVFELLCLRGWARRVLAVTVVVVLVMQLVPFGGRAATRFRVVFGLESSEQYLLRVDDVYPMARRAAETLPAHAKVLFMGERVYHFLNLGVDATMGMPLRQAVVDFAAFESPAQLLARLRELRFTHLIAEEDALEVRTPFALPMVRALENRGLTPLVHEKHLTLYEITPPSDALTPRAPAL